jgi:hypothetical protein
MNMVLCKLHLVCESFVQLGENLLLIFDDHVKRALVLENARLILQNACLILFDRRLICPERSLISYDGPLVPNNRLLICDNFAF